LGNEVKKGTNKIKITLVISVIVIVVLAGLSTLFYINKTSLESQLKEKWDSWGSELWWHNYYKNAYDTEGSLISGYIAIHHHTDSEYDSLNSTYNDYVANHQHANSEYNLLYDIVSLSKSEIWVNHQTTSQSVNWYTQWIFGATYAGYVSVYVESSTTDNTYVQVFYSSHGVSYDHSITVGVSGTARFPILPSGNIVVRVGNTNWVNGATETVTVTYYY
jgi:hypothetical protein